MNANPTGDGNPVNEPKNRGLKILQFKKPKSLLASSNSSIKLNVPTGTPTIKPVNVSINKLGTLKKDAVPPVTLSKLELLTQRLQAAKTNDNTSNIPVNDDKIEDSVTKVDKTNVESNHKDDPVSNNSPNNTNNATPSGTAFMNVQPHNNPPVNHHVTNNGNGMNGYTPNPPIQTPSQPLPPLNYNSTYNSSYKPVYPPQHTHVSPPSSNYHHPPPHNSTYPNSHTAQHQHSTNMYVPPPPPLQHQHQHQHLSQLYQHQQQHYPSHPHTHTPSHTYTHPPPPINTRFHQPYTNTNTYENHSTGNSFNLPPPPRPSAPTPIPTHTPTHTHTHTPFLPPPPSTIRPDVSTTSVTNSGINYPIPTNPPTTSVFTSNTNTNTTTNVSMNPTVPNSTDGVKARRSRWSTANTGGVGVGLGVDVGVSVGVGVDVGLGQIQSTQNILPPSFSYDDAIRTYQHIHAISLPQHHTLPFMTLNPHNPYYRTLNQDWAKYKYTKITPIRELLDGIDNLRVKLLELHTITKDGDDSDSDSDNDSDNEVEERSKRQKLTHDDQMARVSELRLIQDQEKEEKEKGKHKGLGVGVGSGVGGVGGVGSGNGGLSVLSKLLSVMHNTTANTNDTDVSALSSTTPSPSPLVNDPPTSAVTATSVNDLHSNTSLHLHSNTSNTSLNVNTQSGSTVDEENCEKLRSSQSISSLTSPLPSTNENQRNTDINQQQQIDTTTSEDSVSLNPMVNDSKPLTGVEAMNQMYESLCKMYTNEQQLKKSLPGSSSDFNDDYGSEYTLNQYDFSSEWTENDDKYSTKVKFKKEGFAIMSHGHRLLLRMGWNKGEGLGSRKQGLATAIDVDVRDFKSGVGASRSDKDKQTTNLNQYTGTIGARK